jgi:hypothetical protein
MPDKSIPDLYADDTTLSNCHHQIIIIQQLPAAMDLFHHEIKIIQHSGTNEN